MVFVKNLSVFNKVYRVNGYEIMHLRLSNDAQRFSSKGSILKCICRYIVQFMIAFIGVTLSCCNKNSHKPVDFSFEVIGETIALSGEQTSYLLKKDAIINSVYKIGNNGDITTYKLGIDYSLVNGGGIKRTKSSAIPDFLNHKIVFNENGKFKWNADPDRNPEISLTYQIMVDYTTQIDSLIYSKGSILTDRLKRKILSKQDILIYCIGTSISAGAHTLPSYYYDKSSSVYVQLIGKAITKLYGNKVTIVNLSEGGARTGLFTSKLDFISSQKPDIVFIEFGMNEHLLGANMDGNLNAIENGVKKLLSEGIDCSLVGFFQQNPDWELEDPRFTIYFNNKLHEMAQRNNAFFSDIYNSFEQIPKEKLYRDIMGDYMHHPTDFGHKLYYLSTVPLFLLTNKMESELWELIK